MRVEESAAAVDPGLEKLIASWTGERPSPECWIETLGIERARREVEDALRASTVPIVITGPSGHGKSLVLRWLWRQPPSGFAPISVPSEVGPRQIAASILAATRAWPVHDAAGSLARSLRTQALRGQHPVLLVDDLQAMPPATLSELLSIVDASRVEVRWVGAGATGVALNAVLGVLGQKIRSITLDAPWTRADAERLITSISAALPIGAVDALAAIDLDEVLRTSGGNPRLVRADLAARLRELKVPQVQIESDIPTPTAALVEIRASSKPAAISLEPSTPQAPPRSAESDSSRKARLRAARAEARQRRASRSAARRNALRSAVRMHADRFAGRQRALRSAVRSHGLRFAAGLPVLRSAARSHASRCAERLRAFGAEARARVPRISAGTGFAIGGALAASLAVALLIERAPAIAAWSAKTADAYRLELLRTVRSWTPREPAAVPIARVGANAAVAAPARIRVAVNTDPWSNVEVDGVAAGSTPFMIELAPGRHKFRAAMADGRVVQKEIEVTADRNRVTLR